MRFRVFIESSKHDGEDDVSIIAYKSHNVVVIPEIERSFSNLRGARCNYICRNNYNNILSRLLGDQMWRTRDDLLNLPGNVD